MFPHSFQTPIGQAITEGNVNKVNKLIKQGEDVRFKDRVNIFI